MILIDSDKATYLTYLTEDIKMIIDHIESIEYANNSYKIKYKNWKLNDSNEISDILTPRGLKKILGKIIYENYYKRDSKKVPNGLKDSKLDKVIKNEEKLRNRDFEVDWVFDSLYNENGLIIANRDRFQSKVVQFGDFIANKDEYPTQKGSRIHIRSRQDYTNSCDSYYYFYGEYLPDDTNIDESFIRYYFSIDIMVENDKLLELLVDLKKSLNKRYIPFQFKILKNKNKFTRCDTMVLYLERRYFFSTIDFIQNELYETHKAIFRKECPMFAFPLNEGLSFSEELKKSNYLTEISGESTLSFGENRSLLIASCIVSLLKNKHWKNPENILNQLKIELKRKKTGQIDTFFLNKDSESFYSPIKFGNGSINKLQNNKSTIPKIVGFRLCKEAIWDIYNRCTWIEFNEAFVDSASYKTIDNSLFEGLGGVVYFLQKMAENSQNQLFDRYFEGASKCLKSKLKDKAIYRYGKYNNGFYSGDLMSLYILLKYCQTVIDCSEVKWFSSDEVLKSLVPTTDIYMQNGLSGTLVSLLYLYKLTNNNAYFDKAGEIANELLKVELKKNDIKALGIANGPSGIGVALFLFSKFISTEQPFFVKITAKISSFFCLEDQFYSNDFGWEINNDKKLNWEKGTLGIACSRYFGLKYIDNKCLEFHTEFEDACKRVKEAEKQIFENNYENVFDFEMAELQLLIKEDININERCSIFSENLIFEALTNDKIYCKSDLKVDDNGLHMDGFIPSLHSGYAGLGYTFLRLSNTKLPSILVPNTEFSL